jgi:hypothetical protein
MTELSFPIIDVPANRCQCMDDARSFVDFMIAAARPILPHPGCKYFAVVLKWLPANHLPRQLLPAKELTFHSI